MGVHNTTRFRFVVVVNILGRCESYRQQSQATLMKPGDRLANVRVWEMDDQANYLQSAPEVYRPLSFFGLVFGIPPFPCICLFGGPAPFARFQSFSFRKCLTN